MNVREPLGERFIISPLVEFSESQLKKCRIFSHQEVVKISFIGMLLIIIITELQYKEEKSFAVVLRLVSQCILDSIKNKESVMDDYGG